MLGISKVKSISSLWRKEDEQANIKKVSEKTIYIRNIKVYIQEFGEKESTPIVLVHGYGTSAFTWRFTAPSLSKMGYYVVVIDLVGFGKTEKPSWFDYSINSQAKIVIEVMNRLNIKRASLMGSSYGGAVACIIAGDFPNKVEKLILVSPVINNDVKKDFFINLLMFPYLGEFLSFIFTKSKTFFKLRLAVTFGRKNWFLISNNYIKHIQLPLKTKEGRYSALATLRNWDANKIEQNISQIKHHTLIVWGKDDRIIKANTGKKLKKLIPNSKLSIIQDCGHAPHEEKSEQFVSLVKEFTKC